MEIYLYMEISQGNSLCSYLYLKQAKTSIFPPFPFFLDKTGEQEKRIGPSLGGSWYQWEGRRAGKRG
jgi:hypothetical protein